jgi:hypothetical protein
MTVLETQPLSPIITVSDVQDPITKRYIHQLRRLAVAYTTGDESTGGLREP